MNFKVLLTFFLFFIVGKLCYGQGCLIAKYDSFDKVFNRPTASGATTFVPGNGNNFVNYTGVCGIHTYIQVLGASTGSCTVTENQVTKTGQYYTNVSPPFKSPCNVPLDDHIGWMILLVGGIAFLYITRRPTYTKI